MEGIPIGEGQQNKCEYPFDHYFVSFEFNQTLKGWHYDYTSRRKMAKGQHVFEVFILEQCDSAIDKYCIIAKKKSPEWTLYSRRRKRARLDRSSVHQSNVNTVIFDASFTENKKKPKTDMVHFLNTNTLNNSTTYHLLKSLDGLVSLFNIESMPHQRYDCLPRNTDLNIRGKLFEKNALKIQISVFFETWIRTSAETFGDLISNGFESKDLLVCEGFESGFSRFLLQSTHFKGVVDRFAEKYKHGKKEFLSTQQHTLHYFFLQMNKKFRQLEQNRETTTRTSLNDCFISQNDVSKKGGSARQGSYPHEHHHADEFHNYIFH